MHLNSCHNIQTTRSLLHAVPGCEYHSCFIFQRSQAKFWLRDQILAKFICVFPHFLHVNDVVHCHYRIWELSCHIQPVLHLMGLGNWVGDINLANSLTENGTHYLSYKNMMLQYLKSGQDTSFHILSNPLCTHHSTMLFYTVWAKDPQNFQKHWNHLKDLGARVVTWSKLYMWTHSSGLTYDLLFYLAFQYSGFVQLSSEVLTISLNLSHIKTDNKLSSSRLPFRAYSIILALKCTNISKSCSPSFKGWKE